MKKDQIEQLETRKPEHPKWGIDRKVTGNVGLPDVSVLLVEQWFALDGNPAILAIPENRELRTKNRVLLEQGKILASTTMNSAGFFTFEWRDPLREGGLPWEENVYLVDNQYDPSLNLPPLDSYPKITAYRLLTIRVLDNFSSEEAITTPVYRKVAPEPLIQFFGQEAEKDVGSLSLA